jgi:putative transposase
MARPRKNDSDFRHGRHCVFDLHVHLVFVTKYRRHVFNKAHLDAMQIILASVCKDFDAALELGLNPPAKAPHAKP